MLETPSMLQYDKSSEKLLDADNQQGRLERDENPQRLHVPPLEKGEDIV